MNINELKKGISIVLCLIVISVMITGCKGILKNEKKHEALTLNNGKSFISKEFFKKMKDKYPEINFEITNFSGNNISGYARETLKNGDIPDIYISTQPFDEKSQKKYLVDLSGYKFINNYTTSSLSQVENDGEIYLLPTNVQLTGISYNKTLMEKYGWEVPNSFNELKDLAPKIEDKGYDVMRAVFNLDGYPFNYFFNIGNTKYFSSSCGEKWKKEFIVGEAKATGNKNLLDSAKYFKKWVDEGFIKKSELDAGSEPYYAFLNGESVFYMSLGLSEYEHVAEDGNKYEFGVMPWLSENGDNNMLVSSPARYFGINKELTKKSNEQKLKDALKLLEYISTSEGQNGLVEGYPNSSLYITSLKNSDMGKNNPFYGMKDLIEQGNVVNLVHNGWEKLLIKIAQNIKDFVNDDINAKELLQAFDNSYKETQKDGGEDILAKAKHDMKIEDAARICGIAEAKAAKADVALVSHGAYDRESPNPFGVNWYFYKGNVDIEVVNIFATKCSSLTVIEMKGSEIKKLVKKGFKYYEDEEPFKYSMFVYNDKKLNDNKTYKVVAGTDEFSSELQKKGKIIEVSTSDAVREYVKTLGEFSAKDIKW
ncbi:MAG: carbohydrate ABC transporter substrate-binding protein [Lachnospiraceae bacterium]|nr:carbohydrate ABC transporter substrate-binding protein [Lachnospiraceae bacterium]